VKTLRDMTEPELRELMEAMARSIEKMAFAMGVEKPQFALLVWNDPQIAQYISNCTRETMIQALRETTDRIERNQDVPREGSVTGATGPDGDRIEIEDALLVGENELSKFLVGRVEGRWMGFALQGPKGQGGMFVFTELHEGTQLGLLDRERAIRLTGAVACDPEAMYGGIDRWHVPAELRGRPDDFRCVLCSQVGCDGVECQEPTGQEEVGP